MFRVSTRLSLILMPYSTCRIWIQIHSESGFGFTGKSNGLDPWVLSEMTSLLFVYVCDTDITSGFASESTSKPDSPDSRIRISIRQIEYGLYVLARLDVSTLGLSPPPFWRGAQNSWLMMIVWDLDYSLSEPDFIRSSPTDD